MIRFRNAWWLTSLLVLLAVGCTKEVVFPSARQGSFPPADVERIHVVQADQPNRRCRRVPIEPPVVPRAGDALTRCLRPSQVAMVNDDIVFLSPSGEQVWWSEGAVAVGVQDASPLADSVPRVLPQRYADEATWLQVPSPSQEPIVRSKPWGQEHLYVLWGDVPVRADGCLRGQPCQGPGPELRAELGRVTFCRDVSDAANTEPVALEEAHPAAEGAPEAGEEAGGTDGAQAGGPDSEHEHAHAHARATDGLVETMVRVEVLVCSVVAP